MISAKISSKFQLAIPKAIRESLNLKPGQCFSLITIGHVIEMLSVQSIKDAGGSFSDIGSYNSEDYVI